MDHKKRCQVLSCVHTEGQSGLKNSTLRLKEQILEATDGSHVKVLVR